MRISPVCRRSLAATRRASRCDQVAAGSRGACRPRRASGAAACVCSRPASPVSRGAAAAEVAAAAGAEAAAAAAAATPAAAADPPPPKPPMKTGRPSRARRPRRRQPPEKSENSSASRPAITAMPMLDVNSKASTPTPPPVTSAPSLRPKMPRRTAPAIGTAKNRKIARSNQSKPWPPRASPSCRCAAACGAGSASPLMRAISWSTRGLQAAGEVAGAEARRDRVVDDLPAPRGPGTAPSSVLATSMRTLRSFLATMTQRRRRRRPCGRSSRRWRRGSRSWRCLRAAWSAPSASTICVPLLCSKRGQLLLPGPCAGSASSVPVWSMTRAVSAGTGSTSCAAGRSRQASSAQQPAGRGSSAARARCGRLPRASLLLACRSRPCGGVEICASFCTVKLGLGW